MYSSRHEISITVYLLSSGSRYASPPLPPSNAVAQPTRLLHAETPQPPHQTEGQTSLIGLLGLLESYTVPGMWRHGLIPWYSSTALFRCEEGTSDCTPTTRASRLLQVLLGARVWNNSYNFNNKNEDGENLQLHEEICVESIHFEL